MRRRSEAKGDSEAEKNAHNRIHDEQRNGSYGKYYLLICTTTKLSFYVRITYIPYPYIVRVRSSFFFFCLFFFYFLLASCWCCCCFFFLWLSKLLVSMFPNDRLCCRCVEILFLRFILELFFFVNFSSILSIPFICLLFLSFMFVIVLCCCSSRIHLGLLCPFFLLLFSILRFHSVLYLYIYM